MKFKNRITYSALSSAAVIISSIFIPIIPCKQAPNVPNPVYSWTACSLNPDKVKTIGHIVEYFGYTTSLRDAFIISAAISFLAVLTILHFLTRKKR